MSPDALAERYHALRERIANAAERSRRPASAVRLIGAAKRHSAARVLEALDAGLDEVGENYVQEGIAKRAEVLEHLASTAEERPAPRWHLIGRLQRNKARDAVAHFDCIQSLDRESLARALDREAQRVERRIDVLVQVNLSDEAQKGGVAETELHALAQQIAELDGLRLIGLMTLPKPNPDPESSRKPFRRLREIRDTLREATGNEALRELSMGMSADLDVAVEEGATMVRVGTALFGPRNSDEA